MKHFKNVIACLIMAVFLLSLVPPAAAADNDSVLTSLGVSDVTNTVGVSGASRNIVLTVPFNTSVTTVKLSYDGLIITYDTALYKSVVASGPDASVGSSAVQLTVTYNYVAEADGAPKHTTVYSVSVVKAAKVLPTFSGAVSSPNDFSLTHTASVPASDFVTKYAANNGDAIGAIAIYGSQPDFGTLSVAGASTGIFGTPFDISSAPITFTATGPGSVSFDVKAYEGSDRSHPIGNVVLTFTFYGAPEIKSGSAGIITKTVTNGAVTTFSQSDFTSRCNMNGSALTSVTITPANTGSGDGTWKYNTAPYVPGTPINASDIPRLSFLATAVGSVNFDWSMDTSAGTVTGRGTITVTPLTLTPYTSPTPVPYGGVAAISRANFSYTPASSTPLTYVLIKTLPAAADGTLSLTTALPANSAYGYAAIAANTALAANAVIPASYLNYLKLTTKTTTKAAAVSFTWTAVTDQIAPPASSSSWASPVSYSVYFAAGGVLPVSTDMNIPVVLPASSLGAQFSNATSGLALSYVTFTLPDKNTGTLYLNYDIAAKTGTAVAAATKYYLNKNPNIANITFVPAADFTGTAAIAYSAFTDSGTFITGTISVSVVNSPGGTVSLITDKNSALQFDAATIQASFKAATGQSLSYAVFSTPSSTYGGLYYDYTSPGRYGAQVSSGSAYYVYGAPYLSLVTFMPAWDFTGYAFIYFTGYTAQGGSYSCKIVVSVVDSPGGIVNYSLSENSYIALSGKDFSNEFVRVTGSLLSYITFTPPTTGGTLYEQYAADKQTGTKAAAATKYTDGGTPDLSGLTFVPTKDFVGTVIVPYKAYNTAGTAFTGKLKFNVNETSQLISLNVTSGRPVKMSAGDFQGAFGLLSGGKALSYVTFELPSATYGRLYYNYNSPSSYDSAVSAGKKYYVSATPYISGVTFVPADGYNGSFTISYTGVSSGGASYLGKIRVTVSGATSGSVSYTTNSLTPVTFSAADFANAFNPGTAGGALSYVTFSLPYQSYGTLYYGYNASSSSNTPVAASTAYYVSGYPYLSTVTFVPNSSYSGELAISYTAYGTAGVSSSGTIIITINSSDIDTVTYASAVNTPVPLNAEDFNTPFLNKTGSALNNVVFTLPSADQGQLFLGYVSPTSYTAAVSSSVRYYRSASPLLSDITFVPKTGFVGTVTISYTGYNAAGTAYKGKLIINVGNSVPFPDMKTGYEWAKPAISYLYMSGVVKGSTDGNFHPSDNITRGDFILMAMRGFGLNSYTSVNFPDVPLGVYYYSAVATAKAYGITSGIDGKFYPTWELSRQDAMVILAKTLSAKGVSIAQGSMSDLSAFSDASEVSDYAVSAMASLVKAGILTGDSGRLKPKDMITRAEMSLILYNALML